VLRDTDHIGAVAVGGDLANLDCSVDEDGLGVPDSAARAFLEQIVYTLSPDDRDLRLQRR